MSDLACVEATGCAYPTLCTILCFAKAKATTPAGQNTIVTLIPEPSPLSSGK